MKRILQISVSFAVVVMFTFIGITSCDLIQDVDDDNLPTIEPKLVVYGFLSPGDSIRLNVWISEPVEYNKPVKVEYSSYDYYYDYYDDHKPDLYKDADIVIKCAETGSEMAIPYSEQDDFYVLSSEDFEIVRGRTYSLTATTNNPKVLPVEAETAIPLSYPNVYVDDDVKLTSDSWSSYIVVNGHIEDIPNEENYYRVLGLLEQTNCYEGYTCYIYDAEGNMDTINDCSPYPPEQFPNVDTTTICSASSESSYYYDISDSGRDGTNIRFSLDFWYSPYDVSYLRTDITIMAVDKHYYHYSRSIESYWMAEDNPFSEPSPLYSNIKNGLGIFCSYIDSTIVMDFELDIEEDDPSYD